METTNNIITILGSFNTNNGITTFVKKNYSLLTREGFKFNFINIANAAPAKELAMLGDYTEVTQLKLGFFRHIRDLYYVLKKSRQSSSTIHMHLDSLHNFIPILLAKAVGYKRIIIHAHSDQRGQYSFLKKSAHHLGMVIAAHIATNFIACSQYAADFFYTKKVQRKDSFQIILNGIDLDRYSYNDKKAQDFKNKYKIKKSTLLIGHCGRFARQKNHSFLIKVFSEFHKVSPDSKLVLIGNGENYDIVKRKVRDLGLQEDVLFLGYLKNVADVQNAFDIFAFPSLYEGLSLSLIENIANGTTCLVSQNQSPESFFAENVYGLSINEPNAIESWVNKIVEFRQIGSNEKKSYSQKSIALLKRKGITVEKTVTSLKKLYQTKL